MATTKRTTTMVKDMETLLAWFGIAKREIGRNLEGDEILVISGPSLSQLLSSVNVYINQQRIFCEFLLVHPRSIYLRVKINGVVWFSECGGGDYLVFGRVLDAVICPGKKKTIKMDTEIVGRYSPYSRKGIFFRLQS